VRPTKLQLDVLAFQVAAFLETAAKSVHGVGIGLQRPLMQEPHHRHRRLLSPDDERPCDRRTEKRDEVAPVHRLTQRPTVTDKYSRSEPCIAAKAALSCPRSGLAVRKLQRSRHT